MDEVVVDCPTCAEATEHEVLKEAPQAVTVRCLECQLVRSMSPPKMRLVEVGLVISHEDESRTARIQTPADEMIGVHDEFEHEGHRLIVTAVEGTDGRYQLRLAAEEVRTVQAKVFDTVPLKISVNEGERTRSYRLDVEPEFEVPVGLVLEAGGRRLIVKTLKSDQNRTLHKGFLLARNVRRAFCDPAPRRAKVGEVTTARRRGLPLGEKSKAPGRRIKGPRGTGPRRGPKRS